jgi:cbb3-type cytochrome c oxidase subunit II
MDRLTTVLIVAGLAFFGLAFALSGFYPWMITDARHPEATIAQLAERVTPEFRQLKAQFPVEFDAGFPGGADALTEAQLAGVPADDPRRAKSEAAWRSAYAVALRDGRDIYVAEACWHCHSQYVRKVANEDIRFGKVRDAEHYNTALDRPVMWGTRRVGPDLTNEGGLRSNDWHVAHLYDPRSTSPGSVMPAYTWYFHEGWQVFRRIDPDVATRGGLPADQAYALPGLYPTEAEATAAIERARASMPESLAAERDRLEVRQATGPDRDALALVSYLQWLGTWEPKKEAQQ